jgi:hypothetical protein
MPWHTIIFTTAVQQLRDDMRTVGIHAQCSDVKSETRMHGVYWIKTV